MDQTIERRQQCWQALVERAQTEYAALPAAEKDWLQPRLKQIEQLQTELDELFRRADGEQICRQCQGGCCSKGHNHMTLANLLAWLVSDQRPPVPDFSQTCPFLAASGCLLPRQRRPYNCITFICDKIEDSLSGEQCRQFYLLDSRLRSLYLEFSQRYQGGAMTGLLIREQRFPGQALLARISV